MASTAREHPPPSLRYFCWFSFLNICFFEMTLIDVRPKSGDVLWVELTFISVCRTVLGSDPYWRLARRNEARAYKTICILTQLTQNKYVASSSAGINKQSPLCSARLCHAARAWLPSSRNSISILPHGSSQATLGLRTVLKADVRSGVRSWGLCGENFFSPQIYLKGVSFLSSVLFSQTKRTRGCRTVLHSGKAEDRCNSLSQDTLALTRKIFSSDV